MKRIILLSVVVFFFLQSCKKEDPEYCWKCVTKIEQYGLGGNFVNYSDSSIQCGLTEKAAREYEKLHYSKTSDDHNTTEIKMNCKVQ